MDRRSYVISLAYVAHSDDVNVCLDLRIGKVGSSIGFLKDEGVANSRRTNLHSEGTFGRLNLRFGHPC